MNIFFLKAGALMGALSVAIGAFGAHLFKASLEVAGRTETFDTATKYLFYGAFALLAVGLLSGNHANKYKKIAGYLFLIGSIIFSGSLYLICLTGINLFGAVAPIGGLSLITAWIFLFLSFSRNSV